MKRNKIFLAATGLLIAVCGAFATKGVNKLVPTTVWYTNNAGICTSVLLEPSPCTTVQQPFDCKKFLDGALRTIYTTRASQNVCATPYKTTIQQ